MENVDRINVYFFRKEWLRTGILSCFMIFLNNVIWLGTQGPPEKSCFTKCSTDNCFATYLRKGPVTKPGLLYAFLEFILSTSG